MHHQGCPHQVLCDSNVLEPWLDSHPHSATLLPNRGLKSRHSAVPPMMVKKIPHSSQTSGRAGRPEESHGALHGASCSLTASQSHALPVGLAGPAALCSAGRAAGSRTHCSRNPVQHCVGSASSANCQFSQAQALPSSVARHAQVFPYPGHDLVISPSLCQPV